jgi:hypothetical protein
LGLAACGQQQDTPPESAEPTNPDSVTLSDAEGVNSDDWREEYAYTLGVQAYIFSFPWSYFPQLRYSWVTQEPSSASTPYAPLNHFWHLRNYDTLYSIAWLDVGEEPIILSHADVKDRYFTF